MGAIPELRRCMQFMSEEEGLVALDWVAVIAAVIILGVGVASFFDPALTQATRAVGLHMLSPVSSIL
jgi:hypothetical protein